jgi:hypothetical protein
MESPRRVAEFFFSILGCTLRDFSDSPSSIVKF